MGVDYVADKVKDAKSDGHGVSLDDMADVFSSNPMGRDMVRAQHLDAKRAAFAEDVTDVSPLAGAKLALATSKGKGAAAMTAMQKSAKYVASQPAQADILGLGGMWAD
jgi:hypothetical protein